jgi:hypothetical protein
LRAQPTGDRVTGNEVVNEVKNLSPDTPEIFISTNINNAPEFLREIVERVIQEFLEAEMEAHIGAAPPLKQTIYRL